MSPTISLKWTSRRLRQYFSNEEQVEFRLTIQTRTLSVHQRIRELMIRRLWECWLRRCTHRRERSVQTHHALITLTKKIQCHVQGNVRQCPIPSSSRRTGNFIQTLWSGISHENSSWRTKKSNTLRSKIRITSARSEGRALRQFGTNLNRQLRFQDTEICRRGQKYEVARQD